MFLRLRIDDGLANHVSLETVKAVKEGVQALGEVLAEVGVLGVVEAVLEDVAGAVNVAGGRRAVASVKGTALDLEVVLADMEDVVVVEDGLALLEVEDLGTRHRPADEVGLTLLRCAYTLVRAGNGGEARVVVQRRVPLDAVVLDRELGELLVGRGSRLDVVAVPREVVVLAEGVDQDVEELWRVC